MPAIAYASYELQSYADVNALNFTGQINETLDDDKAAELVRAYKACLSYTDHNVGAVLGELKKLGQWESTIVIFWGDHGWKLGHHGAWAKHTNWREDTNSPMMLRIPGKTDGGVRSNALVDHVDVMATLVEAAGLAPLETCPEQEPWLVPRCTEGTSFLPLVASPERAWKNASFSQYQRRSDIMGYSMTLADSRFTAWAHFDASTNTTDLSVDCAKCGLELYDHVADPLENVNLAYRKEHQAIVRERLAQLKAGWRATASGLSEVATISV
jgi:iduronate 2-sulfatase